MVVNGFSRVPGSAGAYVTGPPTYTFDGSSSGTASMTTDTVVCDAGSCALCRTSSASPEVAATKVNDSPLSQLAESVESRIRAPSGVTLHSISLLAPGNRLLSVAVKSMVSPGKARSADASTVMPIAVTVTSKDAEAPGSPALVAVMVA